MRVVLLTVVIMVALMGFNTPAYSVQTEQSTVKEQLSEPLNAGDADMPEPTPDNAANPEMGGDEPYETYDENTGMPDVTESDRLGKVE